MGYCHTRSMTESVYSLLRDANYSETIPVLQDFSQAFPRSRAALSLLAYAYFMNQDFAKATDSYSKLTLLYPESIPYKGYRMYAYYQAQAFYRNGQLEEALRVCNVLKSREREIRQRSEEMKEFGEGKQKESSQGITGLRGTGTEEDVNKLCAIIFYERNDLENCQRVLNLGDAEAATGSEKDTVGSRVEDDQNKLLVKGCIAFKRQAYQEARIHFEAADKIVPNEPKVLYNLALCCYKLKNPKQAIKRLNQLMNASYQHFPELNVTHQKLLEEESKLDEHSTYFEEKSTELEPGFGSLGAPGGRAVLNSQNLKESLLIEAYNLKAAVYYSCAVNLSLLLHTDSLNKKVFVSKAVKILGKMPPRLESEVDPVTLHNTALFNTEHDFSNSVRKLTFLLDNPPYPKQTLSNLVLLYLKFNYSALAAELLTDYPQGVQPEGMEPALDPALFSFCQGAVLVHSAPEDAYKKLYPLLQKYEAKLRNATKEIHQARVVRDPAVLASKLSIFEAEVDKYLPVLMQIAKIYWDKESYQYVEKVLRKGAEFCTENKVWQLNVAHCFFMQEEKYKESVHYYELLVKSHLDTPEVQSSASIAYPQTFEAFDDELETGSELYERLGRVEEKKSSNGSDYTRLLDMTAIVLANLCVAYIMTSQNEKAEDIMKKVEKAEDSIQGQAPDILQSKKQPPKQPLYHLCIINLVIGTLYCSKGNFEFGISRIMKSLEPYSEKIGTDTWFYAKRGFLALAETLSKQMIVLPDDTISEIIKFLEAAENHGKGIVASLSRANPVYNEEYGTTMEQTVSAESNYVSQEARQLRKFFLSLHW